MRGADSCIFCFGLRGAYLRVFNKEVCEDRYVEILRRVRAYHWHPDATNGDKLKDQWGKGFWVTTPAHMIRGVSDAQMYADMPQPLLDYIKSLPEYDAEIFREITGRDDV